MLRAPLVSWCAVRCAPPHTACRGRILAGTSSWTAATSSVVFPYRAFFHTGAPSPLNNDYKASWRLSTTRVQGVGCGLSTLRQLHTTAAALAAPVPPVKKLTAATAPRSDAATASDAPDAKGTSAAGVSSSKAGSGDNKSTSPAKQATMKATGKAPKGNTTDAPAAAGATSEEEAKQKAEKEEEESWWHRWWRSFKSEGKDFSLFYLPIYPGTFFLLYAAFATETLHKEKILDVVLNFMGDYVDRKKMYARIEAWNTWANLGFAFVINELIEVVRFPVVVILYYALKPYSTYFAHWVLKVMRKVRRTKVSDEAKK